MRESTSISTGAFRERTGAFPFVLAEADFEARFFAALAALASLLVHVALLLLLAPGTQDAPPSPPLVVELVSAPREDELGRAPAEGDAVSERAPEEGALEESAFDESPFDESHLAHTDAPSRTASSLDEGSATVPSTDYRQRLRARESAFARDMAVRRARVAALERFLDQQETQRGPGASASARGETSDTVFLCGARDVGAPVAITAARSMARYADLTPVGLFPPRYLDEVAQVGRDKATLGRIEMALPAREVIVQLDEPEGAVFAVGRRDARCLVGFSWSRDVFPLRFRNLPARYVAADDSVRELVMDVVLHMDASFELTVVSGDELSFSRGVLYDREAVARNLEQRATGARVVRDFLGALFGG